MEYAYLQSYSTFSPKKIRISIFLLYKKMGHMGTLILALRSLSAVKQRMLWIESNIIWISLSQNITFLLPLAQDKKINFNSLREWIINYIFVGFLRLRRNSRENARSRSSSLTCKRSDYSREMASCWSCCSCCCTNFFKKKITQAVLVTNIETGVTVSYISQRQAAKELGVSQPTLNNYIKNGKALKGI
jgi:hypothetical protein